MSIFEPLPTQGVDDSKYFHNMQRIRHLIALLSPESEEGDRRIAAKLQEQGDISRQWDGPRDGA